MFVGEAPAGAYGLSIVDGVARLNGRASITGFVDTATYHDYLLAADVAVQLRSMSRGETSRAVLDCMAAGLPLLVNANGSMAELPEGTTLCMPDEFTVEDLIAEGPGSLTRAEHQQSSGGGKRTTTGWAVMLVRPMPAAVAAGSRSQVAFAVWDGSRGEVGARKRAGQQPGYQSHRLRAKPRARAAPCARRWPLAAR